MKEKNQFWNVRKETCSVESKKDAVLRWLQELEVLSEFNRVFKENNDDSRTLQAARLFGLLKRYNVTGSKLDLGNQSDSLLVTALWQLHSAQQLTQGILRLVVNNSINWFNNLQAIRYFNPHLGDEAMSELNVNSIYKAFSLLDLFGLKSWTFSKDHLLYLIENCDDLRNKFAQLHSTKDLNQANVKEALTQKTGISDGFEEQVSYAATPQPFNGA